MSEKLNYDIVILTTSDRQEKQNDFYDTI